jgi:STE24 endopeptidase
LRDYLVGGAVSLAITLPLTLLAYALLRAAPHGWPWWLAAASLPVFLFIAVIQPVFIAPLFNTFTPLQDETLRRDILVMARAQGITARDVYQMDASRQSNAVNAYVVGFGPTHRIVLYDTLLRDFTREEIKFVMAHEMGHYKLGHIVLGISLGVVGMLIAGLLLRAGLGWLLARHGAFFGAASIANPALYPLLLLLGMLLAIISTPISSAISRHIETQADLYALRVYGHPSAGIRAFHKLARLNISLEDPPRWEEVLFYSHPSITRRVALFKAHGGEEEP